MDKKLIAICMILAVTTLSLTCLAASESLVINDNSLTLNDIEFNIPDGYTQDIAATDLDYNVSKTNKASTCILKNGDKKINITVGYVKYGNITEYENIYGINKTISGVAGSFLTDKSKIDDNEVAFLHACKGKSVYISAPDEETISQVVVE